MNQLLTIGIILHAIDKLSSPLRGMQRTVQELGRTGSQSISQFSRSFEVLIKTVERAKKPFEQLRSQAEQIQDIGQRMMLKGTANVMIGLVPTVSAAEFEKGLAEVATLTDMSIAELKEKYGKQILDLSQELGQAPELVIRAMYQAISAGIDPKDVIEFMRKSGKAAIAGVSDIFTATDLATSIKNAFNVPMEEMGKVYDVIFKTVQKGKTTFGEIAHSFQQVGAAAASAGISFEHVQTAVAQMTLGGVTTERAYTSLKYAIDALVAPSEKAKKIFKQLGIEINAETVRQKDLLGIMAELQTAMAGLSEKEQAEIIANIFGSQEAQMFVKDFMTNTEKYKEMLKEIANASGATEEAYKKMESTTAHEFEKMKQAFNSIKIALGASILPAINMLLNVFKTVLTPVAEFVQKHKTLSAVLFGGIIAISAMVAGLGLLGIMLGMAIKGYTNMRIVLSLVTSHKWRLITAIKGMTTALLPNIKAIALWIAQMARVSFTSILTGLKAMIAAIRTLSISAIAGIRAVGVALFTTPIGWIILGVTALVAAGYLLWKNWDKVSKALGSAWSWLKENWRKLLQVFLYINPVIAPIMALRKLVQYVLGIDLFQAGKKLIESLWKGIQSVAMKPVEAVKGIVQKIRNFLPFSPAKEGPFRDLDKVKIIETIAQTIKPTPLVTAMAKTLEPVKAVMQPLIQPVKQVFEPVKIIPTGVGVGGKPTSAITINYTPTINISSTTPSAKEEFLAILKKHQAELLKLIQDAQAKQARLAY